MKFRLIRMELHFQTELVLILIYRWEHWTESQHCFLKAVYRQTCLLLVCVRHFSQPFFANHIKCEYFKGLFLSIKILCRICNFVGFWYNSIKIGGLYDLPGIHLSSTLPIVLQVKFDQKAEVTKNKQTQQFFHVLGKLTDRKSGITLLPPYRKTFVTNSLFIPTGCTQLQPP